MTGSTITYVCSDILPENFVLICGISMFQAEMNIRQTDLLFSHKLWLEGQSIDK